MTLRKIAFEEEKSLNTDGLKSRILPKEVLGQLGSELTGKTPVSNEFGIAIKPLPAAIPMVLCTDPNVGYKIIGQDQKVQEEKSLISQETNIPASISNRVKEIWKRTSDAFHKNPPLGITLTKSKKGEMKNRELNNSHKPLSSGMLIAVIVVIYLLIKG